MSNSHGTQETFVLSSMTVISSLLLPYVYAIDRDNNCKFFNDTKIQVESIIVN